MRVDVIVTEAIIAIVCSVDQVEGVPSLPAVMRSETSRQTFSFKLSVVNRFWIFVS